MATKKSGALPDSPGRPPTSASLPSSLYPAKTFDGRLPVALASARWLSEAQWAREPDPLPDLAIAPGPGSLPVSGKSVGGLVPPAQSGRFGPSRVPVPVHPSRDPARTTP